MGLEPPSDGDSSVTGFDSAITLRNPNLGCALVAGTTTTCGDDERVVYVVPAGTTTLHVTVSSTNTSSGALNLKYKKATVCETATDGPLPVPNSGWQRYPDSPGNTGCAGDYVTLGQNEIDVVEIPLGGASTLSVAFCNQNGNNPKGCASSPIEVEVYLDNGAGGCTQSVLPAPSGGGSCSVDYPRYNNIAVTGYVRAYVRIRWKAPTPPGGGTYALAYKVT